MSDPFKIDGPTCISFSFGRSSAYMLWRVLQSNGGLPKEAVVLSCNTGKEEEESLQFGAQISREFGVPITLLEYRTGPSFEVMTWGNASRNGEPFDLVIKQREPSLPNGRSRYCSSELKTRTMHRYLKSIGWDEWDTFIGIRADEPIRVAKFRSNPHPEGKHETVNMPLVLAGVSSKDVGNFWSKQSFDLNLPNINGKTMHGNCDLCYLKPKAQILSLIAENPDRADWWIKHEEEAAKRCSGDGQFFAIDRPTYAQMLKFSQEQKDMFDSNEQGISCYCGD